VRDLAEKEFLRITKLTAEALGGSADAKYTRGYPVMSNSDQQTEFAAKVARDVSGKCDEAPLVMGGEDFAYMLEERPGAYILIGNGDSAPVHHPEYNFNDDAIPFGCSWLVEIVEQKMPV
jgi:metal-dependent amidase/aminoacylase/carboxypeptidase family protein